MLTSVAMKVIIRSVYSHSSEVGSYIFVYSHSQNEVETTEFAYYIFVNSHSPNEVETTEFAYSQCRAVCTTCNLSSLG